MTEYSEHPLVGVHEFVLLKWRQAVVRAAEALAVLMTGEVNGELVPHPLVEELQGAGLEMQFYVENRPPLPPEKSLMGLVHPERLLDETGDRILTLANQLVAGGRPRTEVASSLRDLADIIELGGDGG